MWFQAQIYRDVGVIKEVKLRGSGLELHPQTTVVVRSAGRTEPVVVTPSQLDDGPIKVGPVPLQPGLNLVDIDAPGGPALTLRSREDGTLGDLALPKEITIGRLLVGCELLQDGRVVAPDWLTLLGVYQLVRGRVGFFRHLFADGLSSGDYARVELHDAFGGVILSERTVERSGTAEFRDPLGGLSDPPLWGPDCVLAIYFVRDHDLLPQY